MNLESKMNRGFEPSEEINNVRKEAEKLGKDPDEAEREHRAKLERAKALQALEAGEKARAALDKFAQEAEEGDGEQMAA